MAKITILDDNNYFTTTVYQGEDIQNVISSPELWYKQTGQPEYADGTNRMLDELIYYVAGYDDYNTPYNSGGLYIYSYQGAFNEVFPSGTQVITQFRAKSVDAIEKISIDLFMGVTGQNVVGGTIEAKGERTGDDYLQTRSFNTADLGTTLEVFPLINYSWDSALNAYKPTSAILDTDVNYREYEAYNYSLSLDLSEHGDFTNEVNFSFYSIVNDFESVNMLLNCFVKSVTITTTKDTTVSDLDKWGSIIFSPDQNIIDKWGGSLETGKNVSIESDSLIEGLNTNRPDLSLDFNVDKTVLTGVNLGGLYDNPIVSVSLGLAVVFIVSGYLLYGKGG